LVRGRVGKKCGIKGGGNFEEKGRWTRCRDPFKESSEGTRKKGEPQGELCIKGKKDWGYC